MKEIIIKLHISYLSVIPNARANQSLLICMSHRAALQQRLHDVLNLNLLVSGLIAMIYVKRNT